ncbi:MAG: restriction endonuclease subunit S [Nanoarchaeota archaeon]
MDDKSSQKWQKEPLKNILTSLESGSRPKGGTSGVTKGVPSLGGEHLTPDGGFSFQKVKFIPEDYFNNITKGKIKQEDILIVKDGATTGKTSYVNISFPYAQAAINEHVFIARPNEKIIPRLLFYYLYSHMGQKQLKKNISGSAQGGINRTILDKIYVPFPDNKDIQIKIVNQIEKQFTRLDSAIKNLKDIKSKLELYRKSVLKAAFEGRLIDINQWMEKNISEISEKIQYGLTSKSDFSYKGPKYLRITDIQNNKVDWENVPYADAQHTYDKYKLYSGDLVFARTGASVGKSYLLKEIPEESVFASYLIRVVPNKNLVSPDLLWFYFQSPMYWYYISRKKVGIGQPNVNGKVLSSMPIQIPEYLKEQNLLANEIEARISVIEKLEETVDKSLKKAEMLKNSILKSAFEGKLVEEE